VRAHQWIKCHYWSVESINGTGCERVHASVRLSEHDVVHSNGAAVINITTFETELILVPSFNIQHGAQSVREAISDGKLVTGVWGFAPW
jgi:hypothetical protein